ncbi:hypothetical protein [Pantoea agglomerans]|uniref:hypothetical protein n=1 Tax=Enterobacter agglomerans TaxID=549 RepID=UPI003C7A5BC5
MENSKLSDVKGKELVAAGHAFAKAIGMDTPLIEIAKMVSVLATRLDCALVRGDACMQAEMVWEKAMMAAIGEDGVGCVVRAIAELKAERDALAAESAARGEIIERLIGQFSAAGYHAIQNSLNPAQSLLYDAMQVLKQPATDAYLNSVRAEGVEMVKAHPAISLCSLTHVCEEIAAQLRAGKDGE